MLAPLEFKSPMEIYPGAIFRYRPCAAGAAPVAYLRADLMAVPSTQRDNASAYAIHSWMRVRTHTSFLAGPVTSSSGRIFRLTRNLTITTRCAAGSPMKFPDGGLI